MVALLAGLAATAEETQTILRREVSQERQQDISIPVQESEITFISEPNSIGQRVIIFFAPSRFRDSALASKDADGKIRYAVYYGSNVEALPTDRILWLSDKKFACVCTGRMRSFYGVYEIAEPDKDYPTQHFLYPLATGSLRFRTTWSVKDGALIGCPLGSDVEVFRFCTK